MAITIDGTNGVTTPAGLVINNAPAFSAYQSTLQALTASTFAKLQVQTEEFDTNNNFDNVTNFRFTPTVAGYYLCIAGFQIATTSGNLSLAFYKNGSIFKYATLVSASGTEINGSALIQCNGSTDFIEVFVLTGNSQNTVASQQATYFQAFMARSA